MKFEGVALAVSSTALSEGNLPKTPLIQSVLRNYTPRRSGDIFVFQPHYFVNEEDGLVVTSTHGSPWRYDTFVPIVFAGGKLTARHVTAQSRPWTLLRPSRPSWAPSRRLERAAGLCRRSCTDSQNDREHLARSRTLSLGTVDD